MSKSIRELGSRLREVMDELDAVNAQKSELWKEYEDLRKNQIPEAMEELGLDSVKITGVGRLALRGDVYATIPAEHRDAAHAWLNTHGFGGMIKGTVNSSTFKAFAKEQAIEGNDLPDELFKVTPYTVASLTRTG